MSVTNEMPSVINMKLDVIQCCGFFPLVCECVHERLVAQSEDSVDSTFTISRRYCVSLEVSSHRESCWSGGRTVMRY